MLTDADRAWAREVAASLPPLTEQQRDNLAALLRPGVLELRRNRRRPRRQPQPAAPAA